MGLETVKEEIIRSAKEQADSLIAEARVESNRITKETEEKVKEMKEKSELETKIAINMINKQELASSELENKKMLLDTKKQIIERAFIEAKKRLESLGSEKREIYIQKLLEKARKEIEIKYVYCNKIDLDFLKDFKTETVDIMGGIIAENEEKTLRVDYSFDTMLQTIKENDLQNINNILFS